MLHVPRCFLLKTWCMLQMTKGWCSLTRPGSYMSAAQMGMCSNCVQQSFIQDTTSPEFSFLVWMAALLPGFKCLTASRLAKATGRSREDMDLLLTAKLQDFPADHDFRQWHAQGVLSLDHYDQVRNLHPQGQAKLRACATVLCNTQAVFVRLTQQAL